ncbi:nidogen-like domain-containing protein [Microcystis aeruginosa]|uniref:nidogen-like domain-containing protein n=1 Tax=Microcystis aeruginosa TaxID=1126 RepID=UPI002FEDF0FC
MIDFFGSDFSTFFVNNNGNLTFVDPLFEFTPSPFPITNQPMIAPYWGDVDTRGTGAVYVASPNESTVVVTWDQVGYYNSQTNLLNTFQVVLRDRPDTGLDGNFDIEFRYGQLQWTTGSASGGSGGLGGTPAQAGFDAGDGINFFTLPGSRTSEVLNLANISNVSLDTPGLWSFAIRNGETPGSTPDNPLLPVIIEDGFQFDFNITEPDRPFFIDPDVAVGYNYIVDSGPNMTSVLLPTGIGDGFYELWSDSSGGNCTDFAFSGTTLTGGTTFNFASPLRCFSVRGIETSAGLDPANPLAFITGLIFESAGSVSMRQIPITVFVDDGTTQVPEPTTSAFIYAGLMGLGLLARKAK